LKMTDGRIQDDFALLAVVDAYKWWINADFGFLQETGILNSSGKRSTLETGSLNEDIMRRIARAYSVSRNIPSHDADTQATVIVDALNGPDLRIHLCKPLPCRAKALVDFTREDPVALLADEKGRIRKRELASALSKLTWFLRPEEWTIFDRFVGVAVLRKTRVGTEQMQSFYQKLAGTWDQTQAALCDAAEDHGFNPLLGYRIADKYLFCHGVGMFKTHADHIGKSTVRLDAASTLAERLSHPSVHKIRISLLASEQVLSVHLGDKLKSLAKAVAPSLSQAGWTTDLASQ